MFGRRASMPQLWHSGMNMKVNPIAESEIRAALVRELGPSALEEFSVDANRARIDVAVITDTLYGYEIKSDLDSFERFSNQIHAYNRVFDCVTLVTGPALAVAAPRIVPSWWGLGIARRSTIGGVSIEWVRAATRNELQRPAAIASLLWREEATDVLKAIGLSRLARPRAARAELFEAICSALDLATLKGHVIMRLLQRAPRSA